MTVSRVINKNVKVSDALTNKVLASVKALNYQLNVAASSTRSGQGRIRVGILYSNPSAAFLNEILVGGFDQAGKLGCQLMLEKCSGLHSQKTAVRRLLDEGVDGLILPPPLCDDRARVQSLLKEGLPLLALGGGEPLPKALSVRIDDLQGALTMTRYLIRLGHRRIGFIRGDDEHAPSQKRYEGFLQGMQEAGLAVDDALIVRGRFTYQSGLEAAETLLQSPRRPTAIFASNDDMAAAVLAVAHGMRIYVPDELSVCGFDDTPVASTVWPQITTIHQPITAMGRAAVSAMFEAIKTARLGRDYEYAHTTMKYSLIERGSTGPAPHLQVFRSQTEGGVLPR